MGGHHGYSREGQLGSESEVYEVSIKRRPWRERAGIWGGGCVGGSVHWVGAAASHSPFLLMVDFWESDGSSWNTQPFNRRFETPVGRSN